MPGRDRTGPAGSGPMTGRGMGICAGSIQIGFGRGCGRGFARGMGRGFGFRASEPISKESRISALQTQITQIQQQIDALEGQK